MDNSFPAPRATVGLLLYSGSGHISWAGAPALAAGQTQGSCRRCATCLLTWSGELLLEPAVRRHLAPEVIASGWLGYAPASHEQIEGAEKRLGVTLPPSYRAFLLVSNGWRDTGHFIERLWGAGEISWHAD